jgi:hypothetical protein
MEYTTTRPDCPSAPAHGSDGPFLNPLGELGIGAPIAPPCPTGWPSCHHTQGAVDKPSACPQCWLCYQALSEWYIRRGQYQRPDVTAYDRLDVAQRFHAPDRPWGEVWATRLFSS